MQQHLYFYFGSLAILVWKCGTLLLKEVRYKDAIDEEEAKNKAKHSKVSKYSKVFY